MGTVSGKRLFFLVTGTVAGVYMTLCLLLLIFQANLVYFPEKQVEATPQQAGLEYETLTLHPDFALNPVSLGVTV